VGSASALTIVAFVAHFPFMVPSPYPFCCFF
jgi:hypothetical protein